MAGSQAGQRGRTYPLHVPWIRAHGGQPPSGGVGCSADGRFGPFAVTAATVAKVSRGGRRGAGLGPPGWERGADTPHAGGANYDEKLDSGSGIACQSRAAPLSSAAPASPGAARHWRLGAGRGVLPQLSNRPAVKGPQRLRTGAVRRGSVARRAGGPSGQGLVPSRAVARRRPRARVPQRAAAADARLGMIQRPCMGAGRAV